MSQPSSSAPLPSCSQQLQLHAIPTRTAKLQPDQLCVMAKPLPHEVLPITAGVRISLVMFYGPQV